MMEVIELLITVPHNNNTITTYNLKVKLCQLIDFMLKKTKTINADVIYIADIISNTKWQCANQ